MTITPVPVPVIPALVKKKPAAGSARVNGTGGPSNKKTKLSRRWEAEFVLEDPKSPLVKASLRVCFGSHFLSP